MCVLACMQVYGIATDICVVRQSSANDDAAVLPMTFKGVDPAPGLLPLHRSNDIPRSLQRHSIGKAPIVSARKSCDLVRCVVA